MKTKYKNKTHIGNKRKSFLFLSIAIALLSTAVFFVVYEASREETNNSKIIVKQSLKKYTHTENNEESNGAEINLEKKNNISEKSKILKSKLREKDNYKAVLEKYKGKEITKINPNEKAVFLTFDAGANADGTDKILEILKREKIKASFFLTGKFIEKYPEKVKKIIDANEDIGNHSYSHPHFTKISKDERISEIKKTEAVFLEKFGIKLDPFFRFPYGDRNIQTISDVNNAGYISVRWAIDSLGWRGASGGMTKELVINRILLKVKNGDILMMHLGSNPSDKTHLDSEALPEIIRILKKRGYSFKTLSESLFSNTLAR